MDAKLLQEIESLLVRAKELEDPETSFYEEISAGLTKLRALEKPKPKAKPKWRTVQAIVEMKVRGSMSEKDFVWAVRRAVEDCGHSRMFLAHERKGNSFGRITFKSFKRMIASEKP